METPQARPHTGKKLTGGGRDTPPSIGSDSVRTRAGQKSASHGASKAKCRDRSSPVARRATDTGFSGESPDYPPPSAEGARPKVAKPIGQAGFNPSSAGGPSNRDNPDPIGFAGSNTGLRPGPDPDRSAPVAPGPASSAPVAPGVFSDAPVGTSETPSHGPNLGAPPGIISDIPSGFSGLVARIHEPQARSRPKKKRRGHKRRRRYSSSSASYSSNSSSASDRSSDPPRRRKRKGKDDTSELLLKGFHALSAQLAAMVPRRSPPHSAPTQPVERNLQEGAQESDRESNSAISIFPSDSFQDSDSDTGRFTRRDSVRVSPSRARSPGGDAPPVEGALHPELPQPEIRPANSDGESTEAHPFAVTDSRFREIMWDIVRVLKIPIPEVSVAATDSRPSYKRRTGANEETKDATFPEFPVDRVFVNKLNEVAERKQWQPFAKGLCHPFRVPKKDLDEFFTVPAIPDAARDKMAADSGRQSLKAPFVEPVRNKLEEVLGKTDTASRMGMKATSFLLLLSEYLVVACDSSSTIPPHKAISAFQCLEDGLRIVLDQFARISVLATTSRRGNVLDAIFLPSDGARRRFEGLPLWNEDLFTGRFQTMMESEAKRLEATDRINLQAPRKKTPAANRTSTSLARGKGFKKPLPAFRGRKNTQQATVSRSASSTSTQPATTGRSFGWPTARGRGSKFSARSKPSGAGRGWNR